MKLEFHPEAEQEFLEAISYYEAEVPGLGARFENLLYALSAETVHIVAVAHEKRRPGYWLERLGK